MNTAAASASPLKSVGAYRLACLLYLSLHCTDARADGGAVRFQQPVGNYDLTVLTSPTPLREGPVDFSALVQNRKNRDLVEVKVTFRLRKAGTDAPIYQHSATHQAATNKLMHAAQFKLPHPGTWKVDVDIAGPLGDGRASFEVEVGEAVPPIVALWPWYTWPFAVVALFGVHRWLVHRRAAVRVAQ